MTAAVGLVTLDLFPVITYWSQPKDLPAGRYRVEFVCDLPLGPCELQCAVVGLSTYGRPFYYVPGLGHVSVSEIAEGEQPAYCRAWRADAECAQVSDLFAAGRLSDRRRREHGVWAVSGRGRLRRSCCS